MNKKTHKNLSWFRPLLGGNSPMSSVLILKEISVTEGEQSAQIVHVLKGVWIWSPLSKG
jgi:hypothetical protein